MVGNICFSKLSLSAVESCLMLMKSKKRFVGLEVWKRINFWDRGLKG